MPKPISISVVDNSKHRSVFILRDDGSILAGLPRTEEKFGQVDAHWDELTWYNLGKVPE